jgi:AcrR family transcriptional regulator
MAHRAAYSDDELMVVSYALLRQNGPVRLSLRSIAARLGVSEPGLLKRVKTKHALLVRVQRWATETTRALVARLDQLEPREGLRSLFRVHARQVTTPRELAHLMSFSALCLADPRLRAHAAERHDILVNAIEATLRRSRCRDAGATARAIVALLDGVSLAWAVHPAKSLEQELLSSLDLILDAGGAR